MLMDQIGWPYDSLDCLLLLENVMHPVIVDDILLGEVVYISRYWCA